jgi:hypothetical protein
MPLTDFLSRQLSGGGAIPSVASNNAGGSSFLDAISNVGNRVNSALSNPGTQTALGLGRLALDFQAGRERNAANRGLLDLQRQQVLNSEAERQRQIGLQQAQQDAFNQGFANSGLAAAVEERRRREAGNPVSQSGTDIR